MTTKLEDYTQKMFATAKQSAVSHAGFLGAYNMGVWGLSVSGKTPLEQGLVVGGDVLARNPRFTDETLANPKARNYVAYYDTPRLWGYGGDEAWSTISKTTSVQSAIDDKAAWSHLVSRWKAVIAQSRYLVDVTSLSPPVTGDEVQIAVCEGVRDCLRQWIRAASRAPETAPRLMIRFMFGMTATHMYGMGANTYWNEFYNKLKATVRPLAAEIRGTEAAQLPVLLYGSDMGRKISTFNHSKIVAGDGQYAVVGGHNMCEEVSSNTAPVIHDMTCEVTGQGAISANAFAGSLWLKAAESGRLWIYKYNWTKNDFADVAKDSTKKWAPNNYWYYDLGSQEEVPGVIANQYWYYPMNTLPKTAEHDPPAGSVPAAAVMGVGRWGDTKVFSVDCTAGLQLDSDDIPPTRACHYAADHVKRLLIKDAANTMIGMCQQDLINAGFFGGQQPSAHAICQIVGRRLRDTQKGTAIRIVVSSRFTQNCEGLAYSYGDGPREAAERISDALKGVAQASSNIKALPDRLAALSLSATPGDAEVHTIDSAEDPSFCTVAPLAFSEATGATRDRGSYVWADARYQMERVYTNGRFWNKADKRDMKFGPGNHAKVLYVSEGEDNSKGLVLIGSDNMYPSPLSEFSFVIEGTEAIEAFRAQYWDPLWGYSARLGFTVKSDGVVE